MGGGEIDVPKVEPEELFKQRLERLERAIMLKEPDRVPIWAFCCFLPVKYLGTTYAKIAYDYEEFKKGTIKFASDFDFDTITAVPGIIGTTVLGLALIEEHPDIAPPVIRMTGPIHDILQDRYTKWPGRELSENTYPQFVGGRFMEADEYDKLADDPLTFINETLIPRVYRSLEKPSSARAYGTLIKLGTELAKLSKVTRELVMELKNKLGYPIFPRALTEVVLDIVGDFMRHPTYTIMDLYRVPDKVRNACDSLAPLATKLGIIGGQTASKLKELYGVNIVLVFIPLHLNEFLSPKLYGEFYWPYLKKLIEDIINAGFTPWIFFEGDHTPHLETLRELPKGKIIAMFERVDWKKVADIVKGHQCIMGGLPGSLLISGTPKKVEEHVKNLLELMKPGGGFILAPAEASSLDFKPENLRAAIEAVKKYGTY
ncbi:MAG: hypothetical protein DRN15_02115 [Thermoprotei archaeon]|nr:MAG: hypothetical protein DRM97_04805 [Thermoprotei archaeon]RLF24752.1 MAG: hypothetical protein DRN15_02115 [Thermoprotei archaeon]